MRYIKAALLNLVAGVAVVAALASCTPSASSKQHPVASAAPSPSYAQEFQHVPGHKSFAAWLQALKAEAMSKGIRRATVEEALKSVELKEKVIALDRKQPESTTTFDQYLKKVVTEDRAQKGRGLLREHAALLNKIGREYGVEPRFIVALWGIETSYGKNTGGFSVIEALATLAYDGRRSEFFRGELLNALKIIDEGHIDSAVMLGSWAGAMGQSQFMPSSFINFAVDYDGDGRKDIWTTQADVFASIANYLSKSGWDNSVTWGRQIALPEEFDIKMVGKETRKTLAEWSALGVRAADGSNLPARALTAWIVIPSKDQGARQAYLAYPNYDVIMKWNRSLYFATSVGLLADRIGAQEGV